MLIYNMCIRGLGKKKSGFQARFFFYLGVVFHHFRAAAPSR